MKQPWRRPSWEHWALFAIVLLALTVRAWGLGSWEWEEDELYTLRDATDLGAAISQASGTGVAARPLYYALQHLLLKFLPATPLFLRIPAYVFGVLGVLATWWVAKRIFGSFAGLVAATFAAVSPWHLFASQFARYWTLVYLEAALFYGAYFTAHTADQPRWYRISLFAIIAGLLTHPTFLFPICGVLIASCLIDSNGQIKPLWPTKSAILNFWSPLLTLVVVAFTVLKLTGHGQALQNSTSRGLGATLQLVPGMIQWMDPVVATAGFLSYAYFIRSNAPSEDRRWGLMAALGTLTAFALLTVASLRTAVYADYGLAALPLVFISIGGVLSHLFRAAPESPLAQLMTGILLIGTLPSTISHLSDGTRFDYRPAFAAIKLLGPTEPIFGGVEDITRWELPSANIIPYSHVQSIPKQTGFWFLASQRRYGLREGGSAVQHWIDWNCRRVLVTEKPRLDYRLYRTELYWCGSDPVPSGKP